MSRAIDVIKALVAMVIIVALLVGVPLALVLFVGLPIDDLRSIFDGDLVSDSYRIEAILTTGLVAVSWLAWVQIAWSLLVELAAAARGRVARRASVFPGFQALARRLVALAMLISSLSGPVSGPDFDAVPLTTTATAAQVDIDLTNVTTGATTGFEVSAGSGVGATGAGYDPGVTIIASGSPTPPPINLVGSGQSQPVAAGSTGEAPRYADAPRYDAPRYEAPGHEAPSYTVAEGDTFWSIAQDLWGDGLRWRDLRAENLGSVMRDGTVIGAETEHVRPGWVLRLPTGEQGSGGPTASPGGVSPALDTLPPLPPAAARLVAVATPESVIGDLNLASVADPAPEADWVDQPPMPGEDLRLVQVSRGDHFWSLATEALADHLGRTPTEDEIRPYWLSMIDLNQDRLAPPEDPDLVYPDQVFILPDLPGSASEAPEGPAVDDDAPEAPVAESDAVETPAPAPAIPAPEIPASEAPVAEHDVAESTVAQNDAAEVGEAVDEVDDRRLRSEAYVPIGSRAEPSIGIYNIATRNRVDLTIGAGGLLLASGALAAMRRRRMYAMAHRPTGRRPRDPEPALTEIERLLAAEADEKRARWVAAAIGSLAARPVWEGEHTPPPTMAQMGDDGLRLHFAKPDPVAAPLPWRSDDGGASWLLPSTIPEAAIPRFDTPNPTPTFVSLSASTLVNLEALGTFGIHGPRSVVDEIVYSLVHELSTSAAAESVDLRTTFHIPGSEGLALVRRQQIEELGSEIEAWSADFDRRLEEVQASTAYCHRLAHPTEPINPMIVVTDPSSAQALGPILGLARTRRLPLAVIVADSSVPRSADDVDRLEARLLVDAHGEWGRLEPFGIDLKPLRLSAPAANDIGALLASALASPTVEVEPDSPRSAPPRPQHGGVAQPPLPPAANRMTPIRVGGLGPAEMGSGSRLWVSLLGDIELHGLDGQPLTSQQLSLVCFLAASRQAGREAIIEALWNGQALSRSRFPNLLAETRSRIGRHHLPESRHGRYRLAGVGCDLDDFEDLVAQAADASDFEAADLLDRALSLVRGEPFAAPARRFWTWVGDHSHRAARVEALIADAALRLADLAAGFGDLDRARAACERGLVASPLDERLITTLTRVHVASGRTSAARRLVDDWERSVSRLDCGEPSDHPRQALAAER